MRRLPQIGVRLRRAQAPILTREKDGRSPRLHPARRRREARTMRSRSSRFLVAATLVCAGLGLFAQSALAWQARVQVVKINQGGNPADTFAFHPTFSSLPTATDFTLKGGETSQTYEVTCNLARPGHNECAAPPNTLRIAEHPTPGYTLGAIACRSTQSYDDNGAFTAGAPTASSPLKPADEVTTDLANASVDLKIHFNEWVACYFTNVAALPVSPAPVPAPVASQPQLVVSPVRVRAGSAKLASSSPCATSNVIVARVTGKRIARVTFSVEGRRVKTLERPNRGGKWVLSTRVRGLPKHGPYRVKARVEFAASSQTKPKTLRILVSRCRSGALRPKFTG